MLQRNQDVPVWGWAPQGTAVTVTFAGQTLNTTTPASGEWMVTLAPMVASEVSRDLVVTVGVDVETVSDVLVGEVWFCSGQSNMFWSMDSLATHASADASQAAAMAGVAAEIASANDPLFRQFDVDYQVSPITLQEDPGGSWGKAISGEVEDFSGTAYYFGKELRTELGVPVAVIKCARSASRVEPWIPESGYLMDAGLTTLYNTERAGVVQTDTDNAIPSTLFNGMVHGLVPYAIKGAVWYQGEANAGGATALDYELYLSHLIHGWRQEWGQGDFPFYFCQIANYRAPLASPANWNAWATIQNEQRLTMGVANIGMPVLNDLGSETEIHPRNKMDVGERLSLWALTDTYGLSVGVKSGPLYKSHEFLGNKVVITFDHVGAGLMVGSTTIAADGTVTVTEDAGGTLAHFQISANGSSWIWADAQIVGDQVEVSHASIPSPVEVRYAYADNADSANLYNQDGLPASVFTTDNLVVTPIDPIVLNSNDSGAGSLRQVIQSMADGATITFDSSVTQVNLTSGEILINKNITLDSSHAVAINAADSSRHFGIYNDVKLTLKGLILEHGFSDANGGSLYANNGDVVLEDCLFDSNVSDHATHVTYGGAIYCDGASLTATRTTFSNNTAMHTSVVQSTYGGGIYQKNDSLTLTDCRFTGNLAEGRSELTTNRTGSGGAIYGDFLTASTISGTVFDGNTASSVGSTARGAASGAAFYFSSSAVDIQRCSILNNVSTAVFLSYGVAGFSSASGSGAADGVYSLSDSTISGNDSNSGNNGYGGGIYVDGGKLNLTTLTIANCTVVDNDVVSTNTGLARGGALFQTRNSHPTEPGASTVNIYNSTIAGNSVTSGNASQGDGGGLYLFYGSMTMESVLLGDNTASDVGQDVFHFSSGFTSLIASNTLVESTDGSHGLTNGVAGNVVGSDPMVGILAYNGGNTQTLALLAGSPAIDVGSNSQIFNYDQRGAPYAREQGVGTDIGAHETQSTPVPTIQLVVGGGSGGGNYYPGRVVDLVADAPSAGKLFSHWTSSDGGMFGRVNRANTTFTMPVSSSGALTLTAVYVFDSADDDGDMIWDGWEVSHFGTKDVIDGTGDSDQDGRLDFDEFIAGSDPNDPQEFFRMLGIAESEDGLDLTLSFTSNDDISERRYRIWYSHDLSPLSWAELPMGSFAPDAGATTEKTFSKSGDMDRGFYRVEVFVLYVGS
ncbi:choice-of-anchor Q domain-containing protein [Haloferula sp.]|uniref:choice-of-anchor Q domain-containing protein n=1 Tax=Haloferula sp. TaxID=2497595 RepID=UPI0032A07A44